MGDPILERAVDYVLADEITHVRMGSKWLTRLTEGDPERRRLAIEFQETIDERFNLGRHPPRGAARAGADLDRHRGASRGRLHRRGDRAAHQDHAAVGRRTSRPLLPHDPPARGTSRGRRVGEDRPPLPLRGRADDAHPGRLDRADPGALRQAALGRHVWDNAQHADAWGRRLPELRAAAQESEPANAAYRGVPGRDRGRRGGPSRPSSVSSAIYRVLKPHLLAVYESPPGDRQSRCTSRPPAGSSPAASRTSAATSRPARRCCGTSSARPSWRRAPAPARRGSGRCSRRPGE